VTENVSVQTEHSYVNLGDMRVATIGGGGPDINEALSFHMVKVGLNFGF
jgi:opacity protein-like surface antigen